MTIAAAAVSAVAVGGVAWLVLGQSNELGPRDRGPKRAHGLDVTVGQFRAVILGVAGAAFSVVYGLTGLLVVSVVPALVVATLPRAYLARSRARRTALVAEAWPDGLRDILSSIRSGSSLPSALESLASYGPGPLREAFQGFAVYARSLGVVAALETIKEDLADPTSDRVLEILILAYERGGSAVADILADLAEATTRDLWAMEQVRTETLEHKINARVVFVLPWVVLVAMTSRSDAFREFYSTPGGVLVVAIGGVMSLVGIALASRLSSMPDEPRVFAGR